MGPCRPEARKFQLLVTGYTQRAPAKDLTRPYQFPKSTSELQQQRVADAYELALFGRGDAGVAGQAIEMIEAGCG